MKFKFDGIYSNEYGVDHDDVHENKPVNGKVPVHKIKYYFNNENYPIVFINTANHAMSYHDTNHRLWKWEYVPWEEDSAIIYDEKPRGKVDRFFGLGSNIICRLAVQLNTRYGVYLMLLEIPFIIITQVL